MSLTDLFQLNALANDNIWRPIRRKINYQPKNVDMTAASLNLQHPQLRREIDISFHSLEFTHIYIQISQLSWSFTNVSLADSSTHWSDTSLHDISVSGLVALRGRLNYLTSQMYNELARLLSNGDRNLYMLDDVSYKAK